MICTFHTKIWYIVEIHFLIQISFYKYILKTRLYGPFLWMEFNYLKVTVPLQGGSLLYTTNFPEIPGTHVSDLRRMKDWVNFGATQWFWTQGPWIENTASWPLGHCSKQIYEWNDFVIVLENITSWAWLFRSQFKDVIFIQMCFANLSLIHKLKF